MQPTVPYLLDRFEHFNVLIFKGELPAVPIVLSRARKIGAKRLYLEGNTKLEASIHLYRKLGFHEISLEGSTYDRCDIIMELKL